MSHLSHNPYEHLPWPQLGDTLRPAVEQIRQSVPPPEALNRSLARARRIAPPGLRAWNGRRVQLFATGIVAATLLITLGMCCSTYPPGGYRAGPNETEEGNERPSGKPTYQ